MRILGPILKELSGYPTRRRLATGVQRLVSVCGRNLFKGCTGIFEKVDEYRFARFNFGLRLSLLACVVSIQPNLTDHPVVVRGIQEIWKPILQNVLYKSSNVLTG